MLLLEHFIVSFLEFFVDTFTTIVIGKFYQFRVDFVLEHYYPYCSRPPLPDHAFSVHIIVMPPVFYIPYLMFNIIVISLTYFVLFCSLHRMK